ncbi:MAG: S9 family peptidase, partial [Bacteroidales bacterium]
MKKHLIFLLAFSLIVIFTGCNKIPERPPVIPVEDFFRKPEKVSFGLSPDGTKIAYMGPYKEKMNVYYYPLDADSAIRLTNETDRSIYAYSWVNNNTILYFKDVGGDENMQIFAVNVNDGTTSVVFAKEGVRASPLDYMLENPNEILITTNERNPQVFDPYRFNLETGEMTLLAENPGDIVGWFTDHDGKLRIAVATDGVNQRLLYRDTEEEEFKTLKNLSFKENFSPVLFDFENENIYASSNLGRDKDAVVLYDPQTDTELELVFQNDEVDVSNLGYSKKREVITHANYYTDKLQRHFFDAETEELYQWLSEKLPGYELSVTSENLDEDKMIILARNDRARGTYYLLDAESKDLTLIHQITPWLNPEHMAEMRPIKFESRDGLTIHGYLTVPKGVEAMDLPVVVNPHGGPWARDYWGFNPEVQMLANRGYAVLQMNFRGSTGYGREFWEISFKEWGRSMQDDITDGVNWLIEQGIADPDRVAICGGSYGGYATLAGLAFTPDLYA